MEIGISTACLYPMEVENSLQNLLDLDFKYFEVFINTFSEIEKPFIKGLKKQLDCYGATVVSVHPFTCLMEPLMFFGDYERRFLDGIELYKKYFEALTYLGGENFVFHSQISNNKFFKITDEQYFERYHRLYMVAKSMGVNFCQENVRTLRSGKIDFIKKMKDYLKDDVAFVFDIKQARIEEQNPIEMIRTMGEKIRQVHISDGNEKSTCLLPGDGTEDFANIIKTLKQVGYDKTLTIEVYSDCISEISHIKNAKNTLKTLIFS